MRTNPLEGIGTAVAPEVATKVDAAMRGSDLDFGVDLVPMKNATTGEIVRGEPVGDQTEGEPLWYQVTRTDTNDVLGVVGQRFAPFQNSDVFTPFAEAFIDSGARITRTATLERGARCFMGFEWDKKHNVKVVGDIVGLRALIQGCHDGRFAHVVRAYPLRLACINGMVVPVPCFNFDVRIKHTAGGEEKLRDALDVLTDIRQYFDTFGEVATQMAQTPVTPELAAEIIETLKLNGERTDEILSLFNGGQAGATHEAVKGTAWGLLNAVTDAADYGERNARIRLTAGNSEANQLFKRAWDGSGTSMRLKTAAYGALLKDDRLGLGEFHKSVEQRIKAQRRASAAKPSAN